MSVVELQKLSKIIRKGWKELASDETKDYESAAGVTKSLLEELEQFESSVETKIEQK